MGATDPTRRGWQWGWLALFAANLPLALAFGVAATHPSGLFGMLAALVLLWWSGHVAVARVPKLRGALAVGGTLVALAQCAVFLHAIAGGVALWLVRALGDEDGPLSEVQAFFATVFTAGQLVCVALLVGGAATWLFGDASAPNAEPTANGEPSA